MNFLCYKYKPKKLEEVNYNLDAKNKLDILSKNKDITNMIFYGPSGSGKKTLLNLFLNQYFDNDNFIYKMNTFEYILSNNYKVIYKVSSKHFQIYFTSNPKNNILIIYELINNLLKSKSVINQYTIIVIHDIDKLQNNIIHLKYISEKYPYVIFLCTSSKLINVSIPFIQIRFCKLNYFDLLKICLKINKNENLSLSNNDIKKIITSSICNLNNLLDNLQLVKNKKNINIDENYNFDILDNIIQTLLLKNINDFSKIKNYINTLFITKSFSIECIVEYIYLQIINYISDKYNFINELAILLQNLIINNDIKTIICIDTFIFLCYKFL
tara:strand:- start:254 stop:1234 length:981 start_codon:yes stop_codon:yes gene_type:complete